MSDHGKRGRKLVLAVLLVTLLAGCGRKQAPKARISTGTIRIDASEIGLTESDAQSGTGSGSYTLPQKTGYEAPVFVEGKVQANGSRIDLERAKSEIGITEASVKKRMAEQTGKYFYDMMEADRQQLYVELLMIIEAHAENVLISTTDADVLRDVFLCMFQDHPELYWIDGYSYSRYGSGANCYYTFSGKYTYSRSDCEAYQPFIDAYVSNCLAGMPQGARDYEKVKYIYEYVIRKTDYDLAARDNQNILSVFVYGKSVCQGYAKAVQYLLDAVEVPCTMVVGKVNNGEGHAWNLVNIDGAYYYLDATWGDAGYLSAEEEGAKLPGGISYSFLNITTEELNHTHTLDNVLPMPYCIAADANYYVREGRYLTGYQSSKIREIFKTATADGKRFVSLKCSSDAVYNLCLTRLLEQQEVFSFLPSEAKSVDYYSDEDLRILSFWY